MDDYMSLILQVPVVEGGDAEGEFHFVVPAEGVEAGDIGEFAEGAVGFGGVPLDGALVADGGLD